MNRLWTSRESKFLKKGCELLLDDLYSQIENQEKVNNFKELTEKLIILKRESLIKQISIKSYNIYLFQNGLKSLLINNSESIDFSKVQNELDKLLEDESNFDKIKIHNDFLEKIENMWYYDYLRKLNSFDFKN